MKKVIQQINHVHIISGALKAAAKADRVAYEGLVGLSINKSHSMGVVVEVIHISSNLTNPS